MKKNNVCSKSINIERYDPVTKKLFIEFLKGDTFEYYDIPYYEFYGLDSADSKEAYFLRYIYNKYSRYRLIF